jgi:hypothetical protein
MWANNLTNWTRIVKRKNGGKCVYCGGEAEEAHHVFQKAIIPELSLLTANGVPVCSFCHHTLPTKPGKTDWEVIAFKLKLGILFKAMSIYGPYCAADSWISSRTKKMGLPDWCSVVVNREDFERGRKR